MITLYSGEPGKDADYEQVMAKLREALAKSTAPEAKQQLAGWKVVKSPKPLTNDGASTYYPHHQPRREGRRLQHRPKSFTRCPTDEEKRAFYDLYKGALKGPLSQMTGNDLATSSCGAVGASGTAAATVEQRRRTIPSHERPVPLVAFSLPGTAEGVPYE